MVPPRANLPWHYKRPLVCQTDRNAYDRPFRLMSFGYFSLHGSLFGYNAARAAGRDERRAYCLSLGLRVVEARGIAIAAIRSARLCASSGFSMGR
jgi:hypothetical protein